jgi:hypothetical protein
MPVDELTARVGGSAHVVPIPADCVDGFTGAFWRRPHAYLDPSVIGGGLHGQAEGSTEGPADRRDLPGAEGSDRSWRR